MADDSFDDWWKALWKNNKVIDFELEKNINEMNDEPNGTINFNEHTPDDSSKAKRMKVNEVNESNSQLYDSIDELLDKEYQVKTKINQDKTASKDNNKEFKNTMLEKETRNYYDKLPENWIEMTQKSGMLMYLHTTSGIATSTRPYFLGSDDPALHILPPVLPSSALKCSQNEKGFETKETIINNHNFQTSKLDNMIISTGKVENVQLKIVNESCFKFQKVNVPLEQSSPELKSSVNLFIQTNSIERPLLPDGNKKTSIPVQSKDQNNFDKWVLHQYGKSYVYVLNEYLTKIFNIKPFYYVKKVENSETPYSVSVILKHIYYGVGFSKTEKQAKLNAAHATLLILIPNMNKIHNYPQIFNQLEITEPTITFFCKRFSKRCPYDMLLLCLQRNFKDYNLKCRYSVFEEKSNEYYMKVGQYVVYANCTNSKDGREMASQLLLSILHPPIDNWGSLLCLYDGLKLKTELQQIEANLAFMDGLMSKSLKDSNTPLPADKK